MPYVVKKARKKGGNAYLVRYHGPDGKTHSRQFLKKVDADRFAASTEVAKNDGSWIDPGGGRVLLSVGVGRVLDANPGAPAAFVARRGTRRISTRTFSRASGRSRSRTFATPTSAARVAELTAAGYAPATVAKGKQILSKVLQAAVDDRRLPFNPADRVPVPRIERWRCAT